MEASKSSPTDQTLHNVINGGRRGVQSETDFSKIRGRRPTSQICSEGQKENRKQKQRFFFFIGAIRNGGIAGLDDGHCSGGGFSEPVARVSLFPVPTTTALQRDGRVTQEREKKKKGNKRVGNLNSIPLPPAGVLVRLWRNLAVTKDAGLWGPTAAGR